jgi:hypothetical protein
MFIVRTHRVLVGLLFIGALGMVFQGAQAKELKPRYVQYEKPGALTPVPESPVREGLRHEKFQSISPAPDPLEKDGQQEQIPTPRGIGSMPSSEEAAPDPCEEEACPEECPEECLGIPYCGAPGRLWIRADYLMWWTSGTGLPPLVVAGPPGTPATEIPVVYGDSTQLAGGRSGVRMTVGGWLDRCHRWGIEADWLYLSGMSNHFEQTTTQGTQVGRPLFDLQKNELSYELADFVSVDADDFFDSTGFWLRYNLCCNENCGPTCGSCGSCGDAGCGECEEPSCGSCGEDCRKLYYCRTDLLAGYRYYVLGDRLTIHENLTTTEPEAFFSITDSFRTHNEFHGAEIGISQEVRRGRFGMNIIAKMALGSTRQIAYVNGFTLQATPEGTSTFNNGILATLPNIQGSPYTREQFTIIPQLGMELSYQLTCRLRGYVGYNIVYWSSVWRAGNQVNLFIDPRNFPPSPQPDRLPLPSFPGQNANFWAQGLNAGMEFRF